jgi:beta-lactamase superfamily II metal-dependent hydrolase
VIAACIRGRRLSLLAYLAILPACSLAAHVCKASQLSVFLSPWLTTTQYTQIALHLADVGKVRQRKLQSRHSRELVRTAPRQLLTTRTKNLDSLTGLGQHDEVL